MWLGNDCEDMHDVGEKGEGDENVTYRILINFFSILPKRHFKYKLSKNCNGTLFFMNCCFVGLSFSKLANKLFHIQNFSKNMHKISLTNNDT